MVKLCKHVDDVVCDWSIGAANYFPDQSTTYGPINVLVRCRFGGQQIEHTAMLDTGCTWVVLNSELIDVLNLVPDPTAKTTLRTRFGEIEGYLDKYDIFFATDFGQEIRVDSTIFFSESWNGPNVIGWKGCLEAIRFALDPKDEMIYYGSY